MKCGLCGEKIQRKAIHSEIVNEKVKQKYWTEGNNAQPVKDGRCCDKCNKEIVIPTRIFNHYKMKGE